MDREGRRRPRDARLLRAALGRGARRGRRERARVALRAHARARGGACRSARIDPAARARCSSARRWCPARSRRAGDSLAHNRELVAEVARARAQGAAAGRAGRRRGDRRRSTSERIAGRHPFARDVRALARRTPSAAIRALLFLTRESADAPRRRTMTEELFPETLALAETRHCRSEYRFAPGQPHDGLTLTVPLALAQPDRRGTALVARAGHDPREGDAAAESAAQGVRNRLIAVARRGHRVSRGRRYGGRDR